MIAEAVEAVTLVVQALAVWIVVLSLAAALTLHAVVAAVWLPCHAAREALAGAVAASAALEAWRDQPDRERAADGHLRPPVMRAASGATTATGPSRSTGTGSGATQGPDGTPGHREAPEAAHARTAPSWAQADEDAA